MNKTMTREEILNKFSVSINNDGEEFYHTDFVLEAMEEYKNQYVIPLQKEIERLRGFIAHFKKTYSNSVWIQNMCNEALASLADDGNRRLPPNSISGDKALEFAKFLEENTKVTYEDKVTLYRYADSEGYANYVLDDIYTVFNEKYWAGEPQPKEEEGK